MAKEDYFKWAESVLDPSKTFEKPEALADLKIVELCTLILGPSLPSYLSELGATVFKVELPGAGDTMRSLTPFAKFFKGFGRVQHGLGPFKIIFFCHNPSPPLLGMPLGLKYLGPKTGGCRRLPGSRDHLNLASPAAGRHW